ncbi:CorA family divalent cation transporter [Arthrobacter cupressi]|uniref:Magnesium transporter n=1 Tax=Arthrobacter cupressi TaxID=1045773 RepID=A0A1G8PHX5_9MICC|nr:CorA family divalent cation transporter [Arthrobacter cupressi]NYD76850.1 magnesium transporter [Arthrobacter cupressi]SDI92104.1 magnesium transporter [Arthrobacter cupressi]
MTIIDNAFSWSAILFAPFFVAGVCGMNFEFMPDLQWLLGYPMASLMVFGAALLMYGIFRRKGWL